MASDGAAPTCPGCEGAALVTHGRVLICEACLLVMTPAQAASRDLFYLLSSDLSARPDRVERGVTLGRAILDAEAARLNANRRHNARQGRVIERGELGRERADRPTTLMEAFGFRTDGDDDGWR